ncbi:hypothetical protein ACE939_02940 [Aquimarina sp. W85]|uniref:hypothetical protein n=1 Tax=Aquimarina rhodophyticola TaxID=3342246 RepID=UPI00366A8B18
MKKTFLFTLFITCMFISYSHAQSFSEKHEGEELKTYKVFENISINPTKASPTFSDYKTDSFEKNIETVSEIITIIKGVKNEDIHHYEHYKKLERSFKTIAIIKDSGSYTSF